MARFKFINRLRPRAQSARSATANNVTGEQQLRDDVNAQDQTATPIPVVTDQLLHPHASTPTEPDLPIASTAASSTSKLSSPEFPPPQTPPPSPEATSIGSAHESPEIYASSLHEVERLPKEAICHLKGIHSPIANRFGTQRINQMQQQIRHNRDTSKFDDSIFRVLKKAELKEREHAKVCPGRVNTKGVLRVRNPDLDSDNLTGSCPFRKCGSGSGSESGRKCGKGCEEDLHFQCIPTIPSTFCSLPGARTWFKGSLSTWESGDMMTSSWYNTPRRNGLGESMEEYLYGIGPFENVPAENVPISTSMEEKGEEEKEKESGKNLKEEKNGEKKEEKEKEEEKEKWSWIEAVINFLRRLRGARRGRVGAKGVECSGVGVGVGASAGVGAGRWSWKGGIRSSLRTSTRAC